MERVGKTLKQIEKQKEETNIEKEIKIEREKLERQRE